MDEKNRNNLLNMQLYIDYIKAIENPDRVGWNGKVWIAPQYKGYDKNQRGYGIDIIKNDTARRLTQNRPGQWLTEEEADKLMKEHLLYVYGAALKHIEGFDNLSDRRKAVLLGMLYRGDSVNKNRHIIDINEPDDNKFFESINNYYKSKGLNERAKNSSNFFNNQTNFLIPMKWEQWEPPMKFKSGGQIRKMLTAAGGPIKYISDIYLKLSDSPLASTIYDGTNLVLYAAAPFTGGATLIPAMAMTGLQATGASANIYDKGLNFLNGTDIASAIPGFGLLNKGVKLAMKPTMKMVGKTTKRVKNATKYLPKKESHPYTYRRMERVGNSGSRRVIRPVEHTIELGKYHPTFWLLAKEDKKYWPAAALVYGEDVINHGLNTYLVVKDIDLKKQGGKMNIIKFLKNGSGIHIKEKNKGKFTSYCGGKVTDECILKGKNSSNPAIRKRATFADNARHFKHKKGGKAFVEGVNVLDSNPKAYKEVKKKYKMRLLGGILDTTVINESPITLQRLNWLLKLSEFRKQQDLKALEEKYRQLLKDLETADKVNQYTQMGLEFLNMYMLNRGNKNNVSSNISISGNSYNTNLNNSAISNPSSNSFLYSQIYNTPLLTPPKSLYFNK